MTGKVQSQSSKFKVQSQRQSSKSISLKILSLPHQKINPYFYEKIEKED
jgi:hypothetical protein